MKCYMDTIIMSSFFITGTDTGIGKTLTAAILLYALKKQYWKPIQAGLPHDIKIVRELTGLSDDHFFPSTYQFNASLSPDQAANLENKCIDLRECILPKNTRGLLVEGAGGVMVPLNANHTMLDLMLHLNFPVVVVARGTLGTLNHTLLTLEALRHRKVTVHGVIFCGTLNNDNKKTIEIRGKVPTLLCIPTFEKLTPPILQHWVQDNKKTIMENFS
jgi:dethiobiotin synthetase